MITFSALKNEEVMDGQYQKELTGWSKAIECDQANSNSVRW